MTRRLAPALWFMFGVILLILSLANGIRGSAGGKYGGQLRIKRETLENDIDGSEKLIEKRNTLQGLLVNQDKDLIYSGGSISHYDAAFFKRKDTIGANKLGLDNRYREKRSTNNVVAENVQKIDRDPVHHNVERKEIPGDLFPETVIHNLEQTSDKVESDMFERKSKIPVRNTRDTRAVYNLDEEVSVEVPLTTKVDETGARVEGVSKRSVAGSSGNIMNDEGQSGLERFIMTEDKVGKESGLNKRTTWKNNSTTRRDEVPLSDNLNDGGSNEDFQIKDKSADLEIHADSSGVNVKAKPASLQVVSNPHGGLKTLPGETSVQGVTAERRTFTPLLPEEEEKRRKHRHHRHHHRLFHGFDSSPFAGYPFLGRRHFHHRRHHHHRLPWLRHRQYINYPDIFERMREQSPLSAGTGSFNPSPSFGSSFPLNPPMSPPMINSPSMMSEGGAGMPQMMSGAGMGSPMMQQLLQRSPIVESNPANRFAVPGSPMEEMPQTPSIGPSGYMGPMGQTQQMGAMEQMMNSMNGMSPMSPMQNSMTRRSNALEFWGVPNQDQLKALSRGENVEKVLGTNQYGENLGGIMGNMVGGGERRGMESGPNFGMGGGMGMNMPGGMNAGMGGPSFNSNGMGNSGMMGQFGTSGSTNGAMFNGMQNGQESMMGNPMRRTGLFKKDDINKTEDYKKAAKRKAVAKAHGKKVVSGDKVVQHRKKFEELLNKTKKRLVSGHVTKNELTPLLREHRIRKSSKSLHDDEKRSLPQETPRKRNTIKQTKQKTKNVKGSKKDVAIQRPPIIYHPPPEVYHRPNVVVHRAPVLFHRPPIVYHQPPVVIHRPAVVYRQPPIIFHQPYPVVNQPYYRAWDNFIPHPVMSHVGSNIAQSYNYLGVPPLTGYRKGMIPREPIEKKLKKGKTKEAKRAVITENKDNNNDKNTKVPQKKKKDVVVNRPPIIYHPPPEVYHRPEIVVHRAPLLIRRPPIVYHQPVVIVHRPAVVYHQPPIVFHQPAPTVNQPVLYSHDNFVVHPSFFATHHGSVVSDAGQLLGVPNTVSVPDTGGFPFQPNINPGGFGPRGLGPEAMGPGGLATEGLSPGGMGPIDPMGRRKRSLKKMRKLKRQKHENAKRKNAIIVKRPPIVYHPPPEVYHRPDIVVHRAPIVIHRGAIVYHQPPVVVHRPSVVYHQPPVLFHQPPPMVQQPILSSRDTYSPHSTLSFVSSSNPLPSNIELTSPNALGKSVVPKKKDVKSTKAMPNSGGKLQESKGDKKDKIMAILNEEIPEHDAKKFARLFTHSALKHVSVRQLVTIMEDHKKNDLKPTIYDSKLKELTIEQLAIVEDFIEQNKVDSEKVVSFLKKAAVVEQPLEKVAEIVQTFSENLKKSQTKEESGSKKEEILKYTEDENAEKKNAVLVKRPPIIYHPPPEVYHRPDIVVHRPPLVIHRAPIVYHQPPVVVHRPAVVYHQPPVLFHQPPPMVHQPVYSVQDMFRETSTIAPSASTISRHATYVGVPSELLTQGTAYGKSTLPQKKPKHDTEKDRRSIAEKEKTENASKKNAVMVKRPPIIYHPPPEVYHRPDIVVHRAPIVIHRAPLVYHQPPVIVHRPAVVYHQPPVIFHQPPPIVHQPMFTSHDTFTPHNTLSLGASSTRRVGDFVGLPPETFATRKENVPRHKDVAGTHRDTIERRHHSKQKHHSKKDKKKNVNRRSRLRKLILSLQKSHNSRKDSGLQALMVPNNPLLQRPPLILQRPPLVMNQPMMSPMVQRVLTPVPVIQQVIRPVLVPVVYHHHHWPVNIHHHHIQPVVVAPPPAVAPHVSFSNYYHTPYLNQRYNPYFYGKSFVPKQFKNSKDSKKQKIDVYDYGVPAHGHVISHMRGHSHVVNHHGYVVQHADCPKHCGTCYPHCPSDCKPHCVTIVHHQHHRPQHIFVDHQHHHHLEQTHFHKHHWPVHHVDINHGYPHFNHRHLGYPYHPHRRRHVGDNPDKKSMVPHYRVYQHVQHWHPPCLHHDTVCHHHHRPSTVYHTHHHPANVYHHHHYHPYPVYHHHEHIKPVIYHHLKPYPIHHHHDHHIHDIWHHDHYHPPVPVPVPVEEPSPLVPYPAPVPLVYPCPVHHVHPCPVPLGYPTGHIVGRSHVPKAEKQAKKSETSPKPSKIKGQNKNKKKDVVVNRPPIIYHPPPEIYHRPEIVVHRAPVLIHRPPIVYHQSSVIVHRPAVVYHQPPIVFHQPAPTVNQPVLYSHDNFVVHPAMFASHAGTMVQSAGHFLGLPTGVTNFPGNLPYPPMSGFNPGFPPMPSYAPMPPHATPFGRKRRSTKSGAKKPDRKNSIVVHRPPVIFHPPPEIYHRPSIVVHRPDVLIHRPPVVYHQSPVVLHRPPVVYHQTPIVFHQPPPMVNQPVFHSHDSYAPHPVFTHYNSDIHHAGSYYGVPHYGEDYHSGFGGFHGGHEGFHGGFGGFDGGHGGFHGGHGGFHGGFGGFDGGHGGFDGGHGGFDGGHGGFDGGFGGIGGGFGGIGGGFGGIGGGSHGFGGGFGPGFGRSMVEKVKDKGKSGTTTENEHRVRRDKKSKTENQLKSSSKHKKEKSERAHRKHSVVVHRPPVIFHPAPEVFHRPAYVVHQPDIVIHRPPVVYHQAPVVVHHPPVTYHQPPVMFHQHHPVIMAPSYHHHQYFGGFDCMHGGGGCFGGGFGGLDGGFPGGFPSGFHGGSHGGFHGGFHGHPYLYGKSSVSKPKHGKHTKNIKASKKHDIVIHRPPLVYHPPPEIYHRPDIIVHRADIRVHRPSVVYDQPSVVLHRPAVIYHEPPVVFHQPPPMVHLPLFHTQDMYEPHAVYSQTDSHVEYNHNVIGIPEHFSAGPEDCHDYFGCHGAAYGKSNIEKHSEKHSKGNKKTLKKRKKDKKGATKNAHKKYHLMVHRPPLVYHPAPTVYHRPDVVVHQPDIVIHRPSYVMHPPSVVVHKPAVVYHEPPVVFHQPPPAVHQPLYNSYDAYAAHPHYTHVGSEMVHGGGFVGHPDYHTDYHDDYHHGFADHHGFTDHGFDHESDAFPGFEKSKIHKSVKDQEEKNSKDKENNLKKEKRETTLTKTKRVQLPLPQKEKTETGTKKNAIVVRRPPIIYHPPPEVYHRPDIVVHRAPIVIQRAPLIYHQAPVIVHRPAVVYHQPAVIFHQPAPTIHQPIYHSEDTFDIHPHIKFSQAGSNIQHVGNYIGIPQEVMHRSKITREGNIKPDTPKQRRALFEENITPVTPLNFFHQSHTNFEQPRSKIPYPSLHALHPYALSYASFPWGYSPRHKRYVSTPAVRPLPYIPNPSTSLLPYRSSFAHSYSPGVYSHGVYSHGVYSRPHVNVNIETVKSKVPGEEPRARRQIPGTFQPVGQPRYSKNTPMVTTAQQYMNPAMYYGQALAYPVLPRPRVNVNVETVKSAVPLSQARARRQVLAGLPLEDAQPGIAPSVPSTYVPVAQTVPGIPTGGNTDDPMSVYKDLLRALYVTPRGTRGRRPKVNIVVQTSKSKIPTPANERRSVLPKMHNVLGKANVDSFNTMPEVATIEPPLLRNGIRVNMVDLGDYTAGNGVPEGDVAPGIPTQDDENLRRFGTMMGPRAQGDFGVDQWKRSGVKREGKVEIQRKLGISEPRLIWQDENAEKKSSVPTRHRTAHGKKRYMVGGYQSREQLLDEQSEPQGEVQTSAATQGAPGSTGYGLPYNGASQPERGHINVNVETVKNVLPKVPKTRTIILPQKQQFQPNSKPSLRNTIPAGDGSRTQNNQSFISKRQQVMSRLPMMQVMPQLRHVVTPTRVALAKPSKRYPSYAVQDAQQGNQPPQGIALQQSQQQQLYPQLRQTVRIPHTESYTQPLLPVPAAPTSHMIYPESLYPWGGRPRPHVNVNIETIKSDIPTQSTMKKIITPQFKREYPVLYSIIKAKAKNAKEKREAMKQRSKRQIPFFPDGGFLQGLIPDANELTKRAFYNVPRYIPAELFPRAFKRPRPATRSQKVSLGGMGAIEIGGGGERSSPSNPASLLKNEFSQSFDDIAKIQSQEVNDIKGMTTMSSQPSTSVVAVPGQSPQAFTSSSPVVATTAEEAPLEQQQQQQQQQQQSFVMPLAAAPQSFGPVPQITDQPTAAQFVPQNIPETAPMILKSKLAAQSAPTTQASPSKTSFFDQAPLPGQVPGFPPGFPFPGVQFLPVPAEDLPMLPQYPGASLFGGIPYPEDPGASLLGGISHPGDAGGSLLGGISHPGDTTGEEEDRPSVKIQVQTSKSKIPKLNKRKLKKKKNS